MSKSGLPLAEACRRMLQKRTSKGGKIRVGEKSFPHQRGEWNDFLWGLFSNKITEGESHSGHECDLPKNQLRRGVTGVTQKTLLDKG